MNKSDLSNNDANVRHIPKSAYLATYIILSIGGVIVFTVASYVLWYCLSRVWG